MLGPDSKKVYKVSLPHGADTLKVTISDHHDKVDLGTVKFGHKFLSAAQVGRSYRQWMFLRPIEEELTAFDFENDSNDLPRILIQFETVDEFTPSPKKMYKPTSNTHLHESRGRQSISSFDEEMTPSGSKRFGSGDRGDRFAKRPGYQSSRANSSGRGLHSSRHEDRYRDKRSRAAEFNDERGRSQDPKTTTYNERRKYRSNLVSTNIHANYDLPENREHVHRKLKNLVSDMDFKKEDLNRDSEARIKVIEWVLSRKENESPSRSKSYGYRDRLERLVDEVDSTYKLIKNQDSDDIRNIEMDISKLQDEIFKTKNEIDDENNRQKDLKRRIDDQQKEKRTNVSGGDSYSPQRRSPFTRQSFSDPKREQNKEMTAQILNLQRQI